MSWQHAVAFLCGAVVLVLEILGTRLVAPIYGASIYVWSALITVTLLALAIGAWQGGRLADREHSRRALALALGGAGIWVLAIAPLRSFVLESCVGLGVRGGALASSALLLGPPLAALGAVVPLCVRMRVKDAERIGREVGGVSSVSTIGSVVGSLGAGFLLVPMLPVRLLLGTVGGLLIATAMLIPVSTGVRPRRSRVAIALGIGLASVLGSWTAVRASEKSGVVHREQSLYGEIVVADDEDRNLRFLVLDGLANTAVRRGTWDSQADSMFGLELAAFARPASRRALLIGLGGGALVHALDRYHALPTDVVEIDPAVVRVAGEMFGFRPSGRVVVGDGRTFLRTSAERWDLILLDVFVGDRQPTHLFSLQSMREASGRLTENGVLAIHAVGWAYGPQSKLRRSIEATLREAFPHVRTLACNPRIPLRDGCGSIVFYASSAPIEFPAALEEARVDLATWWSAVERRFLDEGRNASLDQGPFPTAEILTDETNRFERLSAPAFLHMRAGMLQLPR